MKVLRSIDVRCGECGAELRDQLVEVEVGERIGEIEFQCQNCEGGRMRLFWPLGTRIGIVSDEKPPRDEVESARLAFVQGKRVTPFMGETRTDLQRWKDDNGIIYTSTGDERARGNSQVQTRSKLTESPEFIAALTEQTKRTKEIVESKGDAYHELKRAVERPNDYDVEKFKEQVRTDAVPTDSVTDDIATELTAVTPE